jgi:hypothetical protein
MGTLQETVTNGKGTARPTLSVAAQDHDPVGPTWIAFAASVASYTESRNWPITNGTGQRTTEKLTASGVPPEERGGTPEVPPVGEAPDRPKERNCCPGPRKVL